MDKSDLISFLTFSFDGIAVTESLLTSVIVTCVLILTMAIFSKRYIEQPGKFQTVVEALYLSGYETVSNLLPDHARLVYPFIGTLWVFIFCANIIGLIPGFSSPTADISVTFALAIVVYFAVHWFGIKSDGFVNYIKHYLKPNPLLLPFHLISEVSRTLALAIRLFGNVMSLEMAAYMVLAVAGILVPVPLLMLHIVEAVIQAYLFGMLALIYVAGGIQSHQKT